MNPVVVAAFTKVCHPSVRDLFDHWDQQRGDRLMPSLDDLDFGRLSRHLQNMLIVRVFRAPLRFVYVYVGEAEIEQRGFNPNGEEVATHFFGPNRENVLSCYTYVCEARSCLFDPASFVAPNGRYRHDETLFLPLSNDGETVDHVLVYVHAHSCGERFSNLPPPRLAELVETFGTPAFVLDVLPDGGFRYAAANDALCEAIGHDQPLAGRRPENVLPAAVAVLATAMFGRCAATRTTVEYEEEVPSRSGIHWWRTLLVPGLDDDGTVVRIVGTMTSIDRHRWAEVALERQEALLRRVLASLLEDALRRTRGERFTFHPEENPSFGGAGLALDSIERVELAGEVNQLFHLHEWGGEDYLLARDGLDGIVVPPADEEALALITINPARQLGIADRVGSIEVGKDGDLAAKMLRRPGVDYATVVEADLEGRNGVIHLIDRAS